MDAIRTEGRLPGGGGPPKGAGEWGLFGSLLEVPGWIVGLSPFPRIGLVAAEPFQAVAAIAMIGVAAVAGVAAAGPFGRRDLAGPEP